VILAVMVLSVAVFADEADAAGLVKRAISTAGTWLHSDLPAKTVFTNSTNTYDDTKVQTFSDDDIRIADSTGTEFYTFSTGDLGTNKIVSFPALTADDTLSFIGTSQTWTGTQTFTPKTIHSGGINIPAIADITTNGDFWQSSTTANVLKYRASGTTHIVESDLDVATSFTPADPTAITNAAASHLGIGSTVTVTPASTGRLLVTACGTADSTSSATETFQIRYGTGTAPANAAAVTGTAVGPSPTAVQNNAGQQMPICITAVITGATVGTAHWIDLTIATSAGAGTLNTISVSVVEV